jgi:hypothetical protein
MGIGAFKQQPYHIIGLLVGVSALVHAGLQGSSGFVAAGQPFRALGPWRFLVSSHARGLFLPSSSSSAASSEEKLAFPSGDPLTTTSPWNRRH